MYIDSKNTIINIKTDLFNKCKVFDFCIEIYFLLLEKNIPKNNTDAIIVNLIPSLLSTLIKG